MPDPIPLAPRRDDTAADMRSLVQMGEAEPQTIPAPAPEPAPPVEDTDAVVLNAALLDAGITTTPDDQAAVKALAQLDTATVQAVARWMRTKKQKPDTK
ncbi:hypothetical protein [Streptomyces coeruleorubidus]|uniref:hypothetical protein n=1 Tax=Streptomyces coeruleorubidus TaxID=116188 RepID=UPI0033BE5DE4